MNILDFESLLKKLINSFVTLAVSIRQNGSHDKLYRKNAYIYRHARRYTLGIGCKTINAEC